MTATQIKTFTALDYSNFADLNAEFANIYSSLNAGVAVNLTDESVTDAKLAQGASPATYFGELFADSTVIGTGLAYVSKSGLDVTISAGTAYVLQTSTTPDKLVRVAFATTQTYTVLNNTTNYLDLGADGTMDVVQSANPAADHTRILSVVASGGTITGTPGDEADRTFPDNFGPKNYITNNHLTVDSATQVTLKSGVQCRDTTDVYNMATTADIVLDITNSVGALGLDQGSEASSTWYAVVLIADVTNVLAPSAVLCTEANYPDSLVLPTGYDHYRRVGYVRNDSGSDLIEGVQYGDKVLHYTENTIATSFSTTTFTDQATNSFTCPGSPFCWVSFQRHDGSSAGSQTYYHKAGVGGSTGGIEVIHSQGTTGGHAHANSSTAGPVMIPILNATRQFSVRVTANTLASLDITGYIDPLDD